jgi:hypothetical protein
MYCSARGGKANSDNQKSLVVIPTKYWQLCFDCLYCKQEQMKHLILFLIPNLCLAFSPTSFTYPVECLPRPLTSSVLVDHRQLGKRERHVLASAATKQDTGNNVRYPRLNFSLRNGITKSFHFLIDAAVTVITLPIALILAKIINHPSVREALGQCIVSGIKQMCVDPELDYYFDQAGTILNQDLHQDARNAGEEFPLLARNFVLGVIGAGGNERNGTPKRRSDHM